MCTSNRADDPTQYDLPAPGQRDDDGEPSASGWAAAHDFGDPCECPECAGDSAATSGGEEATR